MIKPSSYRTIGAIADALHNPILLGYGILVIGHTDSVGGRQYNVGLSQRRAEAIRDALIDPFNVNPAVLEAVGMAFYGENWKNRLADDLNIRERALQRWLPGHAPIPEGVWHDLLNLIDARESSLTRVRGLIMQQLPQKNGDG